MTRSIRMTAAAVCAALTMPFLVAAQSGEQTRRDEWQRVGDVIAALGAAPGSHVADVGAGDGYFTTRLSKAVGESGAVYAVDISSQQLARLRARLDREGIANVQTIEGAVDDPRLPEGRLDAALIVNAYHEMRQHQEMLAAIRRALKPQGRLVIIEPISESRRGAARETQERSHEIDAHFVQADLATAGFRVLRFEEGFTKRPSGDHEWIIVASPAPAPPSAPATPIAPATPAAVDDAAGASGGAWLDPSIRIDIERARSLFESGAAIFIDVRGIEMFGEGHIQGARMIEMRGLTEDAPALAASGKQIITYCS